MDKKRLNEIMEMLRTSLTNDDTDDVVLYIGFAKFLNLCEAYVKMRELIEMEH